MGWPGDPMKPRETTMRRACSDSACTLSAVTLAIAAAKIVDVTHSTDSGHPFQPAAS